MGQYPVVSTLSDSERASVPFVASLSYGEQASVLFCCVTFRQ